MAEPGAVELLDTAILLAPPFINIQYISDDVVLQGTVECPEFYLNGRLQDETPLDTATLFFTALPFTTIGAITLIESKPEPVPYPIMEIYSGNTPTIDNGQIIFGDVDIVPSVGYPSIDVIGTRQISGQTDVNQSFRTDAELKALVQGSVNVIDFSKTIFSYLFVPGQPNVIQFRNPLFFNGMIFLKDENGLSDLPATMVLTELDQPLPLLTITGIPVTGENCVAMLIVV